MMVIAALFLAAAPAVAQNLLTNPDFDLDPTVPGNGWTAEGTGVFAWNQFEGDPSLPSAQTTQVDSESMILFQCVEITGDTPYSFSSRSFTHSSTVPATNGVSLSVYPTTDCSGAPIESVDTDQSSFPDWGLRQRDGYITPANALSARIELYSTANGTVNDISWDHVFVREATVASERTTWGGIKARYR